MSSYQVTIRFNLDKPEEQRAAAFLQCLDRKRFKSCNHFLIELINAYQDRAQREQQDDVLVEKIRQMFREEIQEISVVAPAEQPQAAFSTELTEEEQAENAASVLDDLEMFG